MSDAPLAEIRVLDLGRYIAAPYCTMVLADLGADVIRVERPGGEADRRLGLRAANGESFIFAGLGRNKRGVTLDLRAGEPAREILADLIRASDVVLHNYGRGAAAALALDYEHVRAIRADVVYAAITSFGRRGPDAERTGFDPIFQLASGAAAVTGYEGNGPIRAGIPWVDYSTGLAATVGILAALRHRDRTGEGQSVDCALLATAVSYTAPVLAEAMIEGRERPRLGNQPAYIGVSNLFACRDGEVYIVAVSPAAWSGLCRLIGRPELAQEPRLRTPELRFEHRHELDSLVAAWTATITVAEAVCALARARIPCGQYRRPAEVADDPQVRANAMLRFVDLDHDGLRAVPASATPVALGRWEPRPAARPPRAGEHNREVYGNVLGYDAERVGALERAGIV
ncbi:MAG: CaiB/BaiF CoA transferase family protein [Solirubrobacteraceae bacterium]